MSRRRALVSRTRSRFAVALLALGGATWMGCGSSDGDKAETPTQTPREQAEAQRRVIEREQHEGQTPTGKSGAQEESRSSKQQMKAASPDHATTKADREAARQRAQYAPTEDDTHKQSNAGHSGAGNDNDAAADRTEQSGTGSASNPGGAEQGNAAKDRSEQAGGTGG